MTIDVIKSFENTEWRKAILSYDQATPFHTVEWAETLCRSYGYKPFYIAKKKKNEIVGLLPLIEVDSWITGKRAVSLPFTDSCALLTQNNEDHSDYIEKAIQIGRQRKWKSIEFRGSNGDSINGKFVYKKYLNHKLHFNGLEEKKVFKKFRSSTQRNIKKALKNNIDVHVTQSYDGLRTFYDLNCVTRKDHALPPQPFKFFKTLYQNIIEKDKGFIVLAEKEGTPIAGGLYLQFGQIGIYKYGASDRRYQSYRANNLVMWCAIQKFIKRGVGSLDFGRTDVDHHGLLQFKRGWGTVEEEIVYSKYDLRKEEYQIAEEQGERTYPFFAKMPIIVLKAIGRILYRHVG